MAHLFGTDGVRGVANSSDLTPELALAIGRAAAQVLIGQPGGGGPAGTGRPVAVIGRDTRPSGSMLEAAAAAGLASAGCDVWLLGVVPTPAVAFACTSPGVALGLMVSASHNPMPDNGLKLFGPGGHKLPDHVETALEAALPHPGLVPGSGPTGSGVGRISAAPGDPVGAYLEALLATVEAPLAGLRVVVDCAQGAASALAPELYRRAGADVVALHADGDGERINAGCGATHLASLQEAVREHRADLGLAHDGDADRCLAVDADGRLVDGDQILAVCALALRDSGRLGSATVVTTVMANLAFHHAMAAAGIAVVATAVGDRHVLTAMREGGHALGGEQSGHLVFLDQATTGDGLLTGLALMGRMRVTGRSLADLASVLVPLPQVLLGVRVERSRANDPAVLAAVAAEERDLAGSGRILVRASGTEPLVRIMVEAPSADLARAVAERLAAVVAG